MIYSKNNFKNKQCLSTVHTLFPHPGSLQHQCVSRKAG